MALALWCVVLLMWSTSYGALYDRKTKEPNNLAQLQAFADRLEILESLIARQQIVIEVLTENLAQQKFVTADLDHHREEQNKEISSLRNQLQHCDCFPETLPPKQTFVMTRVKPEYDLRENSRFDTEDKEAVIEKENIVNKDFTVDRLLEISAESRLNNTDVSAADRDVIRRSDDAGAWEAVVTQLSQQVGGLQAQVQALGASSTQLEASLRDARTSTYVRWGHQNCPGTAQRVYSGVMGGGSYAESGSGVNNLCLTLSPVFGEPKTYYSLLYGTEFETWDGTHQDKDPVCAVCRAPFSTTVMVPGTNVCTAGWSLQYSGYLMGGHNTDPAGSEFICVDAAMETRVGGNADTQGKLLFYTSTRCGTLPCGPYINDKIVLCAVCSQ